MFLLREAMLLEEWRCDRLPVNVQQLYWHTGGREGGTEWGEEGQLKSRRWVHSTLEATPPQSGDRPIVSSCFPHAFPKTPRTLQPDSCWMASNLEKVTGLMLTCTDRRRPLPTGCGWSSWWAQQTWFLGSWVQAPRLPAGWSVVGKWWWLTGGGG